MPIFPYLPFILFRGLIDMSAEALELPEEKPRPQAPPRRTQPGFDQLWLGSKNPALR
jgi:hypothetical protein